LVNFANPLVFSIANFEMYIAKSGIYVAKFGMYVAKFAIESSLRLKKMKEPPKMEVLCVCSIIRWR